MDFPKGLSYEFVLHLHNAKYMIFYFTNEGWNLCVKTDIFSINAKAYRMNTVNFLSKYIIEAEIPQKNLEKYKDLIEYLLITTTLPCRDTILLYEKIEEKLTIAELSDGITHDPHLLTSLYDFWISSSLNTLPLLLRNVGTPFSVHSYKGKMVCRYKIRNREKIKNIISLDNSFFDKSFVVFFSKVRREFINNILSLFKNMNFIHNTYYDISNTFKYGVWIGSLNSITNNYDAIHYLYGRLTLKDFQKIYLFLEK